ncbi:MAG: methyltransferase [Candidatus Aenigmarchaeota archaeon]|nr:methyltransferase [Candidatus Aenigmarchaeota archaeon]
MKYFYGDIELEIPEGVYEPREDSLLLAGAVKGICNKNILEVGCGSGLISIILGKENKVTAVDINKEAVLVTKENAERNGIKAEVFQSDLFERVKGKFDLVVFNAPYLQDRDKIEGSETWSNKGTIEKFVKGVEKFLEKNGRVLIVISSLTGVERVRELFKKEGFETEIKKEEKVPWERLVVLEAKVL